MINYVWRLLILGLSVGSLVAVGWFAYQAVAIGFGIRGFNWSFLISAAVAQLFAVLVLPFLWIWLLKAVWPNLASHDSPATTGALLRAYGRSWLGRYIPGRVWMFGGRVLMAAKSGVPTPPLVLSVLVEVFLAYGTLSVLGLAFLAGVFHHPATGLLVLVVGLLGIAGILAGGPLLLRLASHLTMRAGKWACSGMLQRLALLFTDQARPLAFRSTGWAIGVYSFHSCLQLVFIVLLTQSAVSLSVREAMIVAGVWALSSILGYVSFFSAGGLGVRDGVALGLLAPVFSAPIAGAIVAASRVIMILADVLFVGIVELIVLWLAAKQQAAVAARPK